MLQDEHFFDNLPGKFFLMLLLTVLSTPVGSQPPACGNLRDPACQCKVVPPYNLLKNPSFESYTACPVFRYREDVNIIDFWQPGTVTSPSGFIFRGGVIILFR